MRTQIGHPAVPRSLIESIVATYRPRRIILFGSQARGDARPDSDLDLLVEVDDQVPREELPWSKRSKARRNDSGRGGHRPLPCDAAAGSGGGSGHARPRRGERGGRVP